MHRHGPPIRGIRGVEVLEQQVAVYLELHAGDTEGVLGVGTEGDRTRDNPRIWGGNGHDRRGSVGLVAYATAGCEKEAGPTPGEELGHTADPGHAHRLPSYGSSPRYATIRPSRPAEARWLKKRALSS